VPALREAVKAWRAGGYKGITDTTRELLNHWFHTDHRLPSGTPFRYHDSQQDAIETLIFVWEVEKVRSRQDLLRRYSPPTAARVPPEDAFARYCTKMATGSGKTKVMALAVAWQFLNSQRETGLEAEEYARTFLLIAPNVIVLERLKTDFAGARILRSDPVIPKHMQAFWDFDCVIRGEGEKAHAAGTLFLTNIDQFCDRPDHSAEDEPDEMTAVLGPPPPAHRLELTDFAERIALRAGKLLVINDEGHHTHEEDNEWNKVIRRLHAERMPLVAQLDFSATPRYTKGQVFPWTIPTSEPPANAGARARLYSPASPGLMFRSNNPTSNTWLPPGSPTSTRSSPRRSILSPLFPRPALLAPLRLSQGRGDPWNRPQGAFPIGFSNACSQVRLPIQPAEM